MTGIIFDIDDTLYSRRNMILRAARDVLQSCTDKSAAAQAADGNTPSESDILATVCRESSAAAEDRFMKVFYECSDENFPRIMAGQITPWQSNVERFVKTLSRLGVIAEEKDGVAFADRYEWMQEHLTLSGQLEHMMDRLASCSGILLGVMTNGTSDRQRKKFSMLGLDRYIDPGMVVVSGEVGASKPDSAIFRAAQERFGLVPDDLWMVGDSVSADIRGAKACGWHTLWLCRGGEKAGKVDADLIAESEEEMSRLVLELAGASASDDKENRAVRT